MKKSSGIPEEIMKDPEMKRRYFEKKLAAYMGFAAKARKLAAGTNTCISFMEKGKALLLIVASDTMEKVMRAAERNGVEYRVFGRAEDLGHYTGEYGAGVFCVTDENFRNVIAEAIDNTSK